jgi:hypothetical protein
VTASEVFVLDANIFIEAAKRYYAFDIAPPFWTALSDKAEEGVLMSIDRVLDEICRGKDDLTKWASADFREWFLSTDDEAVLTAYGQIMQWSVANPQFTDAAKAEFASAVNADAWVVAYAYAKGYVVVTDEVFDPQVRKRIPIPNVCRAFSVRYMNTFGMLRELGITLG